jgi:hypothetical protein
MSVSINGTNGLVFNDGSAQNTSPFTGGFGFRNRIINGDMRIDQRNAGASVTPTGSGGYTLDRWTFSISQASKFSTQQSTVAPSGFINSMLITSLSAYSVAAGDYFLLNQRIEGLNVSDLGWGTASAQTVTLSFQVRSSLTGTFGGALTNAAGNRSYPFSYSVSAANTFETKTITIPGDTSGTWLTTNGVGINLRFGLGVGSTFSSTAGAWAAGEFFSATGATSVVGTNGATFYVTGVDLQKGSTATSFDYRPYGTELALCQRYYQKSYNMGAAVGTATTDGQFNHNFLNLGNFGNVVQRFGVCMRASPTMTVYDGATGASGTIRYWNGSAETTRTTNFALSASEQQLNMADDTFNHTNIIFQWTASAEL